MGQDIDRYWFWYCLLRYWFCGQKYWYCWQIYEKTNEDGGTVRNCGRWSQKVYIIQVIPIFCHNKQNNYIFTKPISQCLDWNALNALQGPGSILFFHTPGDLGKGKTSLLERRPPWQEGRREKEQGKTFLVDDSNHPIVFRPSGRFLFSPSLWCSR